MCSALLAAHNVLTDCTLHRVHTPSGIRVKYLGRWGYGRLGKGALGGTVGGGSNDMLD